jgi:hypothetical protein
MLQPFSLFILTCIYFAIKIIASAEALPDVREPSQMCRIHVRNKFTNYVVFIGDSKSYSLYMFTVIRPFSFSIRKCIFLDAFQCIDFLISVRSSHGRIHVQN